MCLRVYIVIVLTVAYKKLTSVD